MAETEAGNLQAFHEGLQKGKNNNSFNDGLERGMDKGYDKGHMDGMDGHAQGLIAGKNLQLQTIRNVVSQAVNDSVTGFIMSEVGLQVETAVNNAFLAKGAEKGKLPRPRPRLLPKTSSPASTATASASASVSVPSVASVESVENVENVENVYVDFDGENFPTGGSC